MFLLTRHTDFVCNDGWERETERWQMRYRQREKETTEINYRLIYFHLPTPRGYEFLFPFFPPRQHRAAAVDSI